MIDTKQIQAMAELRRALQIFATTLYADDESAMQIASIYPVWAADKQYKANDVISYGTNSVGDPQLYLVLQAHKSQSDWLPDATASLYKKMGISESGYPIWTQPLGAVDAYNIGDIVSYNVKLYKSIINANVWAPDDTNTSLELIDAETGKKISSSNLVVRNSGYSKFANEVVPQGVFDITGIFTRYNNTWQIVLRSTDDLKASETGGTLEKPYTVAQALEKINAGTAGDAKVYATGIIVKVKDVDTGTYGNGTFVISDDGKDTEGKTLEVFRCFNIDGAKWTEETKGILVPGKKVVVSGTLLDYNGTKEIKGGNLISIK